MKNDEYVIHTKGNGYLYQSGKYFELSKGRAVNILRWKKRKTADKWLKQVIKDMDKTAYIKVLSA